MNGSALRMNPLEIASQFNIRPATRDRVKAGHEAILAELKPTGRGGLLRRRR